MNLDLLRTAVEGIKSELASIGDRHKLLFVFKCSCLNLLSA